jgi:hypothetical protein
MSSFARDASARKARSNLDTRVGSWPLSRERIWWDSTLLERKAQVAR